jgi:ubiquinone/menaquinone biosynthesis C-methylase UbiE
MVGDPSPRSSGPAGLNQALAAAYDAAADDWAAGADQLYQALARALVAAAAERVPPVSGPRILDVGAGTGAAGRAARAAGAGQVVSVDAAIGMLRHCEEALHPVAADACALPFSDDSFHLALAAFSLSHLASIGGGLREIRRVAGALAGSAFAPGWTHPAKALVDDALRPFGYQPPAWYGRLKTETEPAASDPAWIVRQAAAAGFREAATTEVDVATGLSTPAALASWRLGLAHVAPFLAGLGADRKAAARRAAEAAVEGCEPLTVSMLVLTAR